MAVLNLMKGFTLCQALTSHYRFLNIELFKMAIAIKRLIKAV